MQPDRPAAATAGLRFGLPLRPVARPPRPCGSGDRYGWPAGPAATSASKRLPASYPKELTMHEPRILLTGLAFGESPRWHEGRLWFCNWGTQEIVSLDLDGNSEVDGPRPDHPALLHRLAARWPPADRLGARGTRPAPGARRVAGNPCRPEQPRLRYSTRSSSTAGATPTSTAAASTCRGAFAPGIVALVTPDGSVGRWPMASQFPNGMAVTPDNSTLIVAESYGNRLTAFDIARRRQPVEPAGMGRPRRRRTRWHLHRCGERGLVRGRSQPALRARPRRRRGAADDRA